MIELYLIRHGMTYGNTLGRYIGTTDEELCPEGRKALEGLRGSVSYQSLRPEFVYVSPLRRCLQTAEILFPGIPVKVCPDFRECDFGEFENKNYKELSGNPAYQAFIDSGGKLPFPGGESREEFEKRCRREFRTVLSHILRRMERRQSETVRETPVDGGSGQASDHACAAFVVHGGTIMSILSAYAVLDKSSLDGEGQKDRYYRWQVKNAEGFRALWDGTDKGGIRLYDISHIGPDSGFSA